MAVAAAGEFAPLKVSDHMMRAYARAGHFPLMAAAAAQQWHTLGFVASVQTFGALALLFFAGAYFAWRGFLSDRARGWSHGAWIAGIVAICFLPSIFPGLSLTLFDYAITASVEDARTLPGLLDAVYGPHGLNARMLPAVFIAERGFVFALIAGLFAVFCHDLAYRLREALEDFGVMAVDEARHGRPPSHGSGKRPRPRHDEAGDAGEAFGGGFGHRSSPPSGAPQGEDARARMVLGVGERATRREIERAYRAQMKRAHPDHGGSVERAAALNAARDALLRR